MTTPRLLANIRDAEGCVLTAYPDPQSPLARACREADINPIHYTSLPGWESLSGRPWTIGDGCTGPDIKPGLAWTQAQADTALSAKIAEKEAQLDLAFPWWRHLDDVRQDAFVELAYNLGVEGLEGFPQTVEAIRSGQYALAAQDLAGDRWARQVGPTRAGRIESMIRTGQQP